MSDKLNPQEEIVKRYLDEQSTKDEALRTLYVPAKIKDCFAYITKQAKKQAKNGCAMVEEAVVYKWARDYYLEVLPKEANKEVVKMASKNVEEIAKAMDKHEVPKVSPEVQKMLNEADKILVEQKEVTVVKDGQKYDKNGNGLLFDF